MSLAVISMSELWVLDFELYLGDWPFSRSLTFYYITMQLYQAITNIEHFYCLTLVKINAILLTKYEFQTNRPAVLGYLNIFKHIFFTKGWCVWRCICLMRGIRLLLLGDWFLYEIILLTKITSVNSNVKTCTRLITFVQCNRHIHEYCLRFHYWLQS